MTETRKLRNLADALSIEEFDNKVMDKGKLARDNYYMLFNKTAQMFDYENLPATIPRNALELLLQMEGSCVIWRVPETYTPVGFGPLFNYESLIIRDSSLYALSYTLADAPDPYHLPYKVVVTNPGFRPTISETLEINKDCIVMRNDTHARGLNWLHKKYAYLLAEAEISLRSTLICLRDNMAFVAKTESQRVAVSKYIKDREEGLFGSILAPDFGNEMKIVPTDGRTNAVELAVNGRQAIYAAWYNEIGLNPSFSLKREYTSAQEIDTNTDLLVPTIDDMLSCREKAVENINKMFGTDISVHKSSAWSIKQEQIENALELEKAQAESLIIRREEGSTDESVQERGSDDAGDSVS